MHRGLAEKGGEVAVLAIRKAHGDVSELVASVAHKSIERVSATRVEGHKVQPGSAWLTEVAVETMGMEGVEKTYPLCLLN